MDREQNKEVFLKCFEVGSRLRVRIISQNYVNNHNCQFPRHLRKKDGVYSVPAEDISLIVRNNSKGFYRIKTANIKIFEENADTKATENIAEMISKVYEDDEEDECCVCFEREKFYVFGPCGHLNLCKECGDRCESCPICRAKIHCKIDKKRMTN